MENNLAFLRDSIEHIHHGDLDSSLKSLLTHYRSHRTTQVADLIERLGSVVGGKTAPPDDASLRAIAVKNRFAELSSVLDFVVSGTMLQAFDRMVIILDWEPDDPRVDRALTQWLCALPFQSTASQKFWNRVFRRLQKAKDRSILVKLAELEQVYQVGIGGSMRQWLTGKVDSLMVKLSQDFDSSPKCELSESESELVAEIGSLLPKSLSLGEQILQRIFEDPSDDDAKLVYADYLMEQQDPHGEFIRLQFQKESEGLSEQQAKEESALVHKHWRDFIGPIHKVIRRTGLEFTKGFVSRCEVHEKFGAKVKSIADEPMWRMVQELYGPAELIKHLGMRRIRSKSDERFARGRCKTKR